MFTGKYNFNPRSPSAPMGIVVGHYVRPVHPSVRRSVLNDATALTLSAISLKFGGMMHSAMDQIAIENGHARHFFACSTELSNFP